MLWPFKPQAAALWPLPILFSIISPLPDTLQCHWYSMSACVYDILKTAMRYSFLDLLLQFSAHVC